MPSITYVVDSRLVRNRSPEASGEAAKYIYRLEQWNLSVSVASFLRHGPSHACVMTVLTMKPSSPTDLLREHVHLTRLLLRLITQEKHLEADYVLAVLRTDLAEMGQVPEGKDWIRPGQAPREGWPVYKAAVSWFQDTRRD